MALRSKYVLTILLGALLGAFLFGGIVYAALHGQKEDSFTRFFRQVYVNPIIGAVLGGVLGALGGWLVARVEGKEVETASNISRAMALEFFPSVPKEPALVQQFLNQFDLKSPRNLMFGIVKDSKLLVLDCNIEQGSMTYPYLPNTVVVIADDSLPAFQLYPQQNLTTNPYMALTSPVLAGLAYLIEAISCLWGSSIPAFTQFQRNYGYYFAGRSARPEVIQRILGEKGIEFFAKHQGWTVRSNGVLLLVCKNECKAPARPQLIENALRIRSLLKDEQKHS